MNKFHDTIVGLGSIGVIETIPTFLPQDPHGVSTVIQALIQIVIGLVTIFKLTKKNQ